MKKKSKMPIMHDAIRKILYSLYKHNKITKNLLQLNRAIIIMKIFFDDKKLLIISSKNIPFDSPPKVFKV